MNRKQQRLDLVLIPLDNFCESYGSTASSPTGDDDHSWKSPLGKNTTSMQVIYSQTSSSWINVNDVLHFLDVNDEYVKFIWASEECGFRHLYSITSSLVRNDCGGGVVNDIKLEQQQQQNDGVILVPRITSKVSGIFEFMYILKINI